jgi:hypothetical protein
MTMLVLLAAAALLAWLAWWWYIGRNRPVMPPLTLDEDDPLMIEAREQARASIPRMLELFAGAKEHTHVKVPFVSNGGATEHLWADLLSVDGDRIHVRYTTPPATHTASWIACRRMR